MKFDKAQHYENLNALDRVRSKYPQGDESDAAVNFAAGRADSAMGILKLLQTLVESEDGISKDEKGHLVAVFLLILTAMSKQILGGATAGGA